MVKLAIINSGIDAEILRVREAREKEKEEVGSRLMAPVYRRHDALPEIVQLDG